MCLSNKRIAVAILLTVQYVDVSFNLCIQESTRSLQEARIILTAPLQRHEVRLHV